MLQQSLVLTGKQQLTWKSNKVRNLEDDEILIQTIAGAISIGAELPQYNQSDVTDTHPRYPRETGYESYGKVIQAGKEVTNIQPGDHVISFYGHKNLGIAKADKVVKVPHTLDCRIALLNILSCDAAKGVLKLQPKPKDKVLVTGAGTIGLLTIHFLKNYMNVEHVDVLEPDETRRKLAYEFGASNTFSEKEQIAATYYKYGLECSASMPAFESLLSAIQYHGQVCILSDGNKDLFYLNEDFYEKELKIVGSSDGWDYQKHALWFFRASDTAPNLSKIFDHEISSDELIDCFKELSENTIRPIKVLVKYFS
jgi:alcohol dehydrogenase